MTQKQCLTLSFGKMNDELNLSTNFEVKKKREKNITVLFEHVCEKTCLWGFANIKGADKPAQISLISAFVLCFIL